MNSSNSIGRHYLNQERGFHRRHLLKRCHRAEEIPRTRAYKRRSRVFSGSGSWTARHSGGDAMTLIQRGDFFSFFPSRCHIFIPLFLSSCWTMRSSRCSLMNRPDGLLLQPWNSKATVGQDRQSKTTPSHLVIFKRARWQHRFYPVVCWEGKICLKTKQDGSHLYFRRLNIPVGEPAVRETANCAQY